MTTPRTLVVFTLLGLLFTVPARADFFDDLGDALGKAADGISETAKNVGDSVNQALQPDPAPAPEKQPAEIRWNQPDRVTPGTQAGFFSDADANTVAPAASAPSSRLTGGPRRATAQADDAPPPRAAPPRRAVNVVAALDPLPGFTAATRAPPPPRYAPASLSALAAVAPAAGNSRKPPETAPVQAPQESGFTVTYGSRTARLRDNNTSPDASLRRLIAAVAEAAKAPGRRVALRAESAVKEGHLAEARRRSFDRAKSLQDALTKAGVRFTQIDLKVDVSDKDAVTLDVYAAD